MVMTAVNHAVRFSNHVVNHGKYVLWLSIDAELKDKSIGINDVTVRPRKNWIFKKKSENKSTNIEKHQKFVGLRAKNTICPVKTCLVHFLVVIPVVNHAIWKSNHVVNRG